MIWFEPPEEALRNPRRLLAYVMTLGTISDVLTLRAVVDEAGWREALAHAPPGIFDRRSWAYWHLVLNGTEAPPLPVRELPDA